MSRSLSGDDLPLRTRTDAWPQLLSARASTGCSAGGQRQQTLGLEVVLRDYTTQRFTPFVDYCGFLSTFRGLTSKCVRWSHFWIILLQDSQDVSRFVTNSAKFAP